MRQFKSIKYLIRGAELLAGIAARTEPNARNWLGELAPRTKLVAGDKYPNIIGG